MFTVSAEVPINDGSDPHLTPEDVWNGIEHHVRTSDLRFVPPGHFFEVIEQGENMVRRRVTLKGDGVSFDAVQYVSFHGRRVAAMSTEGGHPNIRVLSIEADASGEYRLRITTTGVKPGAAHASPEEVALAQVREAAARQSAVRHIEVIRRLVRQGELPRDPPKA